MKLWAKERSAVYSFTLDHMNHFRFTLMRFVSVPFALFLAVDWALLPTQLRVDGATELVVASATSGTFKGQPVAYLQKQDGETMQIACENAGPLCAELRRRKRSFTAWLQAPALFHDPWVVAARDNDVDLVRPADSRSAYFQLKLIWAAVTLVLIAIAFVAWYFAPFSSEDVDT